ncbi:hypothetical protein BHM03_00062592, partial [Ensete ventricosum]
MMHLMRGLKTSRLAYKTYFKSSSAKVEKVDQRVPTKLNIVKVPKEVDLKSMIRDSLKAIKERLDFLESLISCSHRGRVLVVKEAEEDFTEGIEKIARNTPGDHRRKIVKLVAREAGGCRFTGLNWLTKELINIRFKPKFEKWKEPLLRSFRWVNRPGSTDKPSVP